MTKTGNLGPELYDYLLAHSVRPDEVQQELIEVTAALGGASSMQISPDQGAFMMLLAKVLGARNVIEVGTFTGYSSICLARGLAEGGRLICCDVSEEWTGIAREHWRKAGVEDLIDLRIGPALDTLRSLPADPVVDLSFIDADKPGYIGYWEELVPRTRPGGVILVDNVFMSGRVITSDPDESGAAIRAFNDHAAADERVELVMLPIADGLTFARKR
ncbi:O-methyltransferase [Actinomadura scrupuli]|uniref:O-methyltransferase n=1 Tax=Actinomadura scrupuli TaxID=559629 RepID=UPI003D996329